MEQLYNIIRFYNEHNQRIIKRGVSLEEAKAHCENPESSSTTCTQETNLKHTRKNGKWFDGYTSQ